MVQMVYDILVMKLVGRSRIRREKQKKGCKLTLSMPVNPSAEFDDVTSMGRTWHHSRGVTIYWRTLSCTFVRGIYGRCSEHRVWCCAIACATTAVHLRGRRRYGIHTVCLGVCDRAGGEQPFFFPVTSQCHTSVTSNEDKVSFWTT
jgi:hypothetical protein